jgi:hypothetical protein
MLTISGMKGPFGPWLKLVVSTVEDFSELRERDHIVAKLRRRIIMHELHDPRLVIDQHEG